MTTSHYSLSRDCAATLIPAGTAVMLRAGQVVHVIQTLGGNITVRTEDGLYRIAAVDAGALPGFELAEPEVGRGHNEFSEDAVWAALRTCFDPEIPVNIVDLGLVYDLSIERTTSGGHTVAVKMTLTAPGCGMGPVIAEDARKKIATLPTVESAMVHIVWDPQWTPQMISPDGRRILGLE